MVRKPASMYRQIKGQAYTRREYMGGVPASRVSQYEMGNLREDFPVVLTLRVKNRVQIRHTSIEARSGTPPSRPAVSPPTRS